MYGNLCIFCQYCHEPKTALKNKIVKNRQESQKRFSNQKDYDYVYSQIDLKGNYLPLYSAMGRQRKRCILNLIQTHTQTILSARGENAVPCISRQSMLLFNKMYHSPSVLSL